MKRAYKFRIYPDKHQEVRLNRTLDTCRHLYNDSLAERKRQAELNRLSFDFYVFPWVCLCGQSVQKNLSVRVHKCPSCGLTMDRDHIAAKIILNRSTVGTTGIKACQSILNREPMKQEASQL